MIRFGELGVGGQSSREFEIVSPPKETHARFFSRWITKRKTRWNLRSNGDENPIHQDTKVAQDFLKIAYPEKVVKILELDKNPIIAPGLWLLAQSEQIAAEELSSEPLLPIFLDLVFSSPLIVDSPQLVLFEAERKKPYQYRFQAEYFSPKSRENPYKKIFEKPIMESRALFVFCTLNERGSGINGEVREKFAEVLSKRGKYINQGKEARKSYCKSVGFSSFKKIYGKENVSPTLIAARIPSDIAEVEIYQNPNEMFLWTRQRLYFNQTLKIFLGEYVEEKILVGKEREGLINIDTAFLKEDGQIISLGRSTIKRLTRR